MKLNFSIPKIQSLPSVSFKVRFYLFYKLQTIEKMQLKIKMGKKMKPCAKQMLL